MKKIDLPFFCYLTVIVLLGAGFVFVLIPKVREFAIRAQCQANLRGLGSALSAHCYPPETNYPTRLSALSSNDISPLQFICPGGPEIPNGVQLTLSYITQYSHLSYVAGLGPNAPGEVPVILCPPINHGGKGGNVLFGDYSATWLPPEQFDSLMDWTYTYAKSNGLRIVVSDALTKRSKGRYKSRP